ncbi:sugar-binding transcriptional regulator [Frigidibacter sp. ROC022]|uniref:sugar-binding transcriptional regulator n=1 Tax=Frigidibacter sp. ROC022 TaxID=2971796 RepID=UPI00215AB5C8|nr:sugar-binding transcriptional regulator [Frigidibacter sp. ROC022]MCR8726451.1 sugar-binding transcriptional regulator [Frigidibacter sp. ROC022]
MAKLPETDATPLDDAARAGWLYYVGGKTQDQIAQELGVSRQRAQRLVSRAMAEGLIHVRLEHRVSGCLDLEAQLRARFGLQLARVTLSLGPGVDPVSSLAPTAAAEMERFLRQSEPLTMALGTGRTLRATVESLTRLDAEQHKIVSLIGNIAPDGSASYYDVIIRISDKVLAPHFPMPIPVVAENAKDRDLFLSLKPVQRVMGLAERAQVTFVGVGQMSDSAPLLMDGFITRAELEDMQARGAAGEIAARAFDSDGRYIEGGTNARVCAVEVAGGEGRSVIGIAAGADKTGAIAAALKGNLLNGLITDETTARALLS